MKELPAEVELMTDELILLTGGVIDKAARRVKYKRTLLVRDTGPR